MPFSLASFPYLILRRLAGLARHLGLLGLTLCPLQAALQRLDVRVLLAQLGGHLRQSKSERLGSMHDAASSEKVLAEWSQVCGPGAHEASSGQTAVPADT